MRERVVLDRAPLEEMRAILGSDRAEQVVGGAMEELAVWISRLPLHLQRDEPGQLAGQCRRIAPMAARLGMPLLARVAEDLCGLSDGYDPAALAAVLERCVRVGEDSLVAVWDLQDLRV